MSIYMSQRFLQHANKRVTPEMTRVLHIGDTRWGRLTRANLFAPVGRTLPHAFQSVDFAYANLQSTRALALPLFNELFRVARQGMVVVPSPLHTLLGGGLFPDEVAFWTEYQTNLLSVLPIPEQPVAPRDVTRWNRLWTTAPPYRYTVFEWTHPMEFNVRVLHTFDSWDAYLDTVEQALEESAEHTRRWLAENPQ